MKLLKTIAAALVVVGVASTAKAANIVETAVADGRFTKLVAAVQAAGLADALQGPGPLTVFAPTDAAFDALGEDAVASLLKPENKGRLTNILLYHVDDRRLLSSMLPHRTIPVRPLLASEKLCITRRGGAVSIGDSTPEPANVVIADIRTTNGVIHVIDKVLIPGRRSCGH